mmetsp:Transcript_12683/g.1882  ORF Transcript_12683/g.1882 Transcript_12683/m.1882 type:complete len:94 (-) Transcript_12683:186-467(-)
MSLRGSHGGHFSCGDSNSDLRDSLSATGRYFEVVPYFTSMDGNIDYDRLRIWANIYKPRIITVEPSSHSRNISWDIMENIAKECNAVFVADIS